MAYIRVIGDEGAQGRLRAVYEAARSRAGEVANIVRVMGLDARTAEASMGLYVAVMKAPGALSRARREMLATVVSNVNDCFY